MKYLMTDDEFDLLRRILQDAAGLVHDESRRDALAFSVSGRIDATGSASVAAYLGLLGGPGGAAERQRLIDVVTIQETHFFRNPPQIRALRQHVLPELVRRSVARGKPLTIWSAGCSTGEEPYSLAMLVRELLPMATHDHVRIIGSDVSSSALAFAAAARYGARAVQMAESVDLARWFGVQGDSYVVRDDVRELVELRLHNLITEPPPFEPGEVDLLLCRNVTIYFNRATTKALMSRFHSCLSDGGYMFLGHSETLWQMSDAFTLVPLGDAFVYRRDDGPEARATLPDRRTEFGDAPILLPERRGRSEHRRRGGPASAAGSPSTRGGAPSSAGGSKSLTLPPGQTLPGGWPPTGVPPMTLPTGQPGRALPWTSTGTSTGTPTGTPAGTPPVSKPAVPKPAVSKPAVPKPAVSKPAVPKSARPANPPAAGHQRRRDDAVKPDRSADRAADQTAGFLAAAKEALAAGRYAAAVAAAARAAKNDPMLVDPQQIAGEAMVKLGRDGDAVKELRQAVYLQPDCGPAHLLLAGALDRLGEPAAAGRAYRATAATVADLPPDQVAGFFGGREAAELVELCIRLAMRAERAARAPDPKRREQR
jgi:chemotaxis protein methyltransferase CheR